MDLQKKLQAFQQKYVNLEEQSENGSLTQQVYRQVVWAINASQHREPAKQRAFKTQIDLVSLAKVLDPPRERHVVWEVVAELEKIAELLPRR